MKAMDNNMSRSENEENRLALLALFKILDSGEDQIYDDLTLLASHIAQTPLALISIIDRDRQWFKSKIGVAMTETPREMSFCAHAINNPSQPLIVADATKDKRFMNNPLVTGDPKIRFYFGVPLLVEDNLALGTLCVIDQQPRSLSPGQIEALNALARQTVTLLKIRKCVVVLGEVISDQKLTDSKNKLIKVEALTRELHDLLLKKEMKKK